MKRLLSAVAIFMVAVLALAGCGISGNSSKSAGKHMNIGFFWFGDSLDPAHEWDGWTVQRIGVGETLVTVTDKMEFAPQLADKWEVVNPTTWKFHIRENVKFHNGNPVTAEAVKASLERTLKENKRAVTASKIASMTANGQDLIIETTEPYGAFLANITEPLFIIVDTKADLSKVAEAPIATGPYAVTAFKKNDEIKLKKNEHYWDGTAKLDTITIKNIEDPSKRAMALQSGEMDMIQMVVAANKELFKDTKKYSLIEGTGVRTMMLNLNVTNGPLTDLNLRKAISYALQYDEFAPLYGPGSKPAGAPFPPTTKFGYDKLTKIGTDAAKAEAAFKAAGYTKNAQGFWEKDGKELTLTFAHWGKVPAANEAIQNNLQKAGVKVEMKRVKGREDESVQGMQGFDILENVYVTATTNDSLWFLGQVFKTGAKGNKGGYSSAQVDELLAKLEVEFDVNARRDITFAIEQQILADAPVIFLAYPGNSMAAKANVKNAVAHPLDYYLITKDLTIEK